MKVTSITFTLARSMPVQPLSGRSDDQYASIRPSASATIELTESEAQFWTERPEEVEAARKIVQAAFDFAAERCFAEMQAFGQELRSVYTEARKEAAAKLK